MTVSIKTNQLSTRKQVEIDGHHYTVRRMGNIEQLDLNQYIRQLKRLAEIEKTTKLTHKQDAEIERISTAMAELFVGLFDDHGDQSKSRKLVASLDDVELGMLLSQIFDEKDADVTAAGTDEKS